MQPKTSIKQKIFLVIGSLGLIFIILEITLRIGGFIFLVLQKHRNIASIRQRGEYRIMCLGESTTALGGNDSYPSQLEEVLNQRSQKIKFSVINKGIPGASTADILFQLEENINRYSPNMIMTMMGINDGSVQHMPYEGTVSVKLHAYLVHFKVYKLARYIGMHIAAKAGEIKEKYNKKVALSPSQLSESYAQDDASGKLGTETPMTIMQNPIDGSDYIRRGWFFKGQGKFIESEKEFIKAIQLSPGSEDAYIGLGYVYLELRNFSKMEESFRQAIAFNPRNDSTYVILSHMLYCCLGKPVEAEALFKKAIELNPKNENAYFELGWFYVQQGMPAQAREMLEKALECNPFNEKAYAALAVLSKEKGEQTMEKKYYKKIDELQLGYYNSTTRDNYKKLKKVADKRGIKLVCAQYPMRSIEPLKIIFADQDGVTLVNNEKIFKEALGKGSYKEYFTDMFAGDFGHCTAKGNRLLGKNITHTILSMF